MRRLVVSLFILIGWMSVCPARAWAQQIDWIRQFGTWSVDRAFGVSADASGVYVAGLTQGTLPGQCSAGAVDAFVRKYDPNGNEVWTSQFGGEESEDAFAIAVDASGVYVAGSTAGTLPGQTSAGSEDVYVRKLDLDGHEVWTRQFGSSDFEEAYGVAANASGVYVSGQTEGMLPGQTNLSGLSAYVRKYDLDGNEVWTRQFGTPDGERAFRVAADASGVYVVGFTYGIFPGQTSAGDADAYVRRYDVDGNEVWTRQFGTSAYDDAFAISVAATGVFVAGSTDGTLPGQTSSGSLDVYVRKYDLDGNEAWTRQFGSASFEFGDGISVDASGVYVSGLTRGTLPGQTSAGDFDAYVRKYDLDGNEEWTRQFGTSAYDDAFAISVAATGVFVAGTTDGTLPGQTSPGATDAHVIKFHVETPAELVQQLIETVLDLNLKQGISNSLDGKLDAVVQALDDVNQNNNEAAINTLQAFINAVEAQRGVNIDESDADALIAAAQRIIALLGGGL